MTGALANTETSRLAVRGLERGSENAKTIAFLLVRGIRAGGALILIGRDDETQPRVNGSLRKEAAMNQSRRGLYQQRSSIIRSDALEQP